MKAPRLIHRCKLKDLTADLRAYALAEQVRRETLADERGEWPLLLSLLLVLTVGATAL